MSLNLAFFKNQSIATVFPLWPVCLRGVLEELAKHWSISWISLDSTAIPFEAEIYRLKNFQKLSFRNFDTQSKTDVFKVF